jgi:hypothetical protein
LLAGGKQQFDARPVSQRAVVKSILYVHGGPDNPKWTWGGSSPTAAALLWEGAWEFFQSVDV